MERLKMPTNVESPPCKKSNVEVMTPHRLTVAILIRDYCLFRDSDRFSCEDDGVLKARYRRDFCVLILKLLQSPDLSLEELRNILVSTKYEVHQSVIEAFDETLASLYTNGTGTMLDIIDSFNRIMTFNENIAAGIEPNCFVSKSSIVGYYLRRLIVNFDKLTFSEVTSVYLTFKRYYEDWQKSLTTRDQIAIEVNKVICPDDWSANRNQWSRRQAELFIATQAALLTNNEEKALPPQELHNRISNLLQSNRSLAEAHFLSYLNYLRVKEFCGAIDSLYHCFDRSTLTDTKISSEDKSKVYRFAALNLAILHHHFGHKEEALASLREAIKSSQVANDNVCLQHALCWLYRLTPVNKEKLLEHSVAKSFELNLSYTASLGIQTFVQYACLISGHPHQIFETLTKGDLINCQHILRDLISNSYAVKSALWQFYGKTEMSSLWSQLLFYLNIDNGRSNDGKAVYGEGFCLAICNVANHLLMQGNYNLVNTVLNFAKDRFPNEPNSHIWMLCENLFIFVRALHHENWSEAEAAAQKILVVDKWEGYLRLAELYYYKQDYTEAHRFVDILINRFHSDNKYKLKIFYYVRAKILLAEIQFSSCYPDKVSPEIMTLLSNCLLDTDKHNLDYHSALIHLHIANIQLSLGMTSQALKILDRCLVQILAHGGNFDRARAVLLYVKCLVAHSAQLEATERREIILNAAQMLEKVKEDFRAVEAYSRVKDVLYLQAQLYNSVDLRSERNRCALEFRQLDEERTTKNYYTLVRFL
ncbi:anaphase-promoting complex subunit 5 [Tribolium castaneum]|nr:PREDICTED: anaphase-promoting complex subunit 5 [Tribolium castaneum]|eukprot:XP_008190332.1 PREDICTED: anaphase-promoting complex subunit 5 [Tribolium castaneum]